MATDTSKYKLNHTMLRIKDPKRTIQFYEFLGMKLVNKLEFPDNKFDLYFLGYDGPQAVSSGNHWTDREGLIELTHNYGTENDDSFKVNNGNVEPHRGFGHVAITVDHIHALCQQLEDAGHKFQKTLSQGRMNHIAFVLDPDGYWVELLSFNNVEATKDQKDTDKGTYRSNHSMLRVKDIEKSLAFYQDVMGMKLKRKNENPNAGFSLYFLGYGETPTESSTGAHSPLSVSEGLLELTWNHGTEKDPNFKYHDGNSEPQGFGHIAVTVDDLDSACARFEEKGVRWKKRLTDGRMKTVAFILDPDDYWIEVLQNEKLKPRSNW